MDAEILNNLTRNYRDAEYIELEVRYKFLLADHVKAEQTFKEEWKTSDKCGCIFDRYKDSCDHMHNAMRKDKALSASRKALWDISMKMFRKTNNGLYFLTAEQYKK